MLSVGLPAIPFGLKTNGVPRTRFWVRYVKPCLVGSKGRAARASSLPIVPRQSIVEPVINGEPPPRILTALPTGSPSDFSIGRNGRLLWRAQNQQRKRLTADPSATR